MSEVVKRGQDRVKKLIGSYGEIIDVRSARDAIAEMQREGYQTINNWNPLERKLGKAVLEKVVAANYDKLNSLERRFKEVSSSGMSAVTGYLKEENPKSVGSVMEDLNKGYENMIKIESIPTTVQKIMDFTGQLPSYLLPEKTTEAPSKEVYRGRRMITREMGDFLRKRRLEGVKSVGQLQNELEGQYGLSPTGRTISLYATHDYDEARRQAKKWRDDFLARKKGLKPKVKEEAPKKSRAPSIKNMILPEAAELIDKVWPNVGLSEEDMLKYGILLRDEIESKTGRRYHEQWIIAYAIHKNDPKELRSYFARKIWGKEKKTEESKPTANIIFPVVEPQIPAVVQPTIPVQPLTAIQGHKVIVLNERNYITAKDSEYAVSTAIGNDFYPIDLSNLPVHDIPGQKTTVEEKIQVATEHFEKLGFKIIIDKDRMFVKKV